MDNPKQLKKAPIDLDVFGLTTGELLCTDTSWLVMLEDCDFYKFTNESLKLFAEVPYFKNDPQTSEVLTRLITILTEAVQAHRRFADIEIVAFFEDLEEKDYSPSLKRLMEICDGMMKFFPMSRPEVPSSPQKMNLYLGFVYILGCWQQQADAEGTDPAVMQALEASKAAYISTIQDHYTTLKDRYKQKLFMNQCEQQKREHERRRRLTYLRDRASTTFRL